jgi:hypothetical protein
MKKKITLGTTLMRCEQLKRRHVDAYLNHLRERGAKIETWDSDESVDPGSVPAEKLFDGPGFSVWYGKHEMSVSLLARTGTYLASVEAQPAKKAGPGDALKLLVGTSDELFEALGSEYGFVDLHGDPPEGLSEAISSKSVRWLFWVNYFGTAFVEARGADYLKRAPFERVDDLPGGAIKCMTRPAPYGAADASRTHALIEYFGGPGKCDVYDAAKHPIDL